jgi:L-threonylcarbamoyladenylate synthase
MATLVLVPPSDPAAWEAIVATRGGHGARVAALLRNPAPVAGVDRSVSMPADAAEYARILYAVLHELDDAGFDLILVESPPADSGWAGVADRLERAATSA